MPSAKKAKASTGVEKVVKKSKPKVWPCSLLASWL